MTNSEVKTALTKSFMKGEAFEAQFKLSNGTTLNIVHNIPGKGPINSGQAALDNWLARTGEYTEKSFCDYINSKGVHQAMTKRDWEKHIKATC